MTAAFKIAPVRRVIAVAVPQALAFEAFTTDLGAWWPASHHLGKSPLVRNVFETGPTGRWYSEHEDGSIITVARVRAWEPPDRVVFTWDINAQWQPDASVASEVEVRFIAEGPEATRVELEHRGFEVLGEADGRSFSEQIAGQGGWTGILGSFQAYVENRKAGGGA